MSHLRRCLRAMPQQTTHWHLSGRAVLQHLVLEIVFGLLDVVPLAPAITIVRTAVLIGIHLDIVPIYQEYRRVLSEKFLQTYQGGMSIIISVSH